MRQDQRSGNSSTNIQANNIYSINTGVNRDEARAIALEVFKANFLQLSGTAKETAEKRAVDFTDHYFEKLAEIAPSAIGSATDPDMQYAMFTAQRDYARSGNEELEGVLIDILVQRAEVSQHSLEQNEGCLRHVVLNEAIEVTCKLTNNHYRLLALLFVINHTCLPNTGSDYERRAELVDRIAMSLFRESRCDLGEFKHMLFVNCCERDATRSPYIPIEKHRRVETWLTDGTQLSREIAQPRNDNEHFDMIEKSIGPFISDLGSLRSTWRELLYKYDLTGTGAVIGRADLRRMHGHDALLKNEVNVWQWNQTDS